MEATIYFKLLLVVIALLAIAFAGLGITMLIKKGGKFPSLHIGQNKEMKKKGITCANSTDKRERNEYKAIKIKKNK